ncbi:MAG: AbrB/MazE/SpoVT family DNA-binding domain-containing protein, partial [Candidatus Woesearchaeota archaeon]
MNRKIVKHGMSTLTVSLPAKWVKKHQLQQGDEISIIEKDQNLLISMQKMKEKEIHLTLPSSSERYIRSYLGRAYKKGYSTIHLSFSSSDTIVAIKHAVANLSGAEIL